MRFFPGRPAYVFFSPPGVQQVSENVYNAFFVDLFVRVSNTLAINMYNAFGYSVYRRVLGYYSGEEDAFGETLEQVDVAGNNIDSCM